MLPMGNVTTALLPERYSFRGAKHRGVSRVGGRAKNDRR
jgi:hypothetical protein